MFNPSVLADIDINLFPASYPQARLAWLERLQSIAYPQQYRCFPITDLGPAGEELFTDSIWLGDAAAPHVLVLVAGTHGVEGFTGSAIQLDLLALLADSKICLPDTTALLLIHALTPWGYAWLRRCDAEGVDLNRNAVDFSQNLPENLGYAQIRTELMHTNIEQRQAALEAFTQQYGRNALDQALSGGQYLDPAGPFYGGGKPAHGRLVCEALIRDYALAQRRLAVIDLHTGLGAYGYGELICDHQPGSAGATAAQQWYGDAVTLPFAGTSSSVPKLGLMDYLWHAVMNAQSCFVTLEFGTFSTDHLFEILLRDHQLWAQSGNTAEREAHSQIMLQHFCPRDPAWRQLVVFRARQVILQGLQGLGN